MANNVIMIKSNDNTDTLIFVDKIQYIMEKRGHIEICLRDNVHITTTANFGDIKKALEAL